jgi:hypothetical protein
MKGTSSKDTVERRQQELRSRPMAIEAAGLRRPNPLREFVHAEAMAGAGYLLPHDQHGRAWLKVAVAGWPDRMPGR